MRWTSAALMHWLQPFVRIVSPMALMLAWGSAIVFAALVHVAFLVAFPDHFLHEDSAAYLAQAQAILSGQYADDPGRRPYGVAFFLVLLSKLFSQKILAFVITQHILSIASAAFLAAAVRFAGAPHVFSMITFCGAALYARTVHYDNEIGAETISVFLTSLAVFISAGLVFKGWPRFLCALAIGLSLGSVIVCRSAAIGTAGIIFVWLAIVLNIRATLRLRILAASIVVAAAVCFTPAAVNLLVGKRQVGSETLAVMAFVVGYSADFNQGVHLDRKAHARQYVDQMRAADGPYGWADINEYQWPFEAINLLRRQNDSDAIIEKVVRDIFIETLTTPATLWRHISKHFIREMYFLLFDGNIPARQVANPQGYQFFVKRDAFPMFKSPTGKQYRRLIYDYYSPPEMLSWLLPSADVLQVTLDSVILFGYSPNSVLMPLCCGLEISTEYDNFPGPVRWLSAATLILLTLLLVNSFAGWFGWCSVLPRNLVAAGWLMVAVALINAAFPAFLVYGYNRYMYYVAPFMAGATGILGALLFSIAKHIIRNLRGQRRNDQSVVV